MTPWTFLDYRYDGPQNRMTKMAKENSHQQMKFIRRRFPNVGQVYWSMFHNNKTAHEEDQELSYIYIIRLVILVLKQ